MKMSNLDHLRILIARRFGDVMEAGNNEIRVDCPFCRMKRYKEDTDHKLYINPIKDVYHCFKCDSAGLASELIPQIVSIETFVDETITNEPKEIEPFPVSTPLNMLDTNHESKLYLDSRGYSFLRDSSEIFFCPDYCKKLYSFGPRIVFPIYQYGVYKGFQCRAINNTYMPKYVFSGGIKKATILYNFDQAIMQSEYVVIVEGIFDALKDMEHAVAIFGKSISEYQKRLLTLGNFKKVMIFLDKDALPESTSLAKDLACYYDTYIVNTPYKDLGEVPCDLVKPILDAPEFIKRIY
jgi:hypothetical protein